MSKQDESVWHGIRARLTFTNVTLTLLGMVGMAVLTGLAQPALSWFTDTASAMRDDWTCKGRQAMAEGDRLSELAAKDAGRAQALFREANAHYEKAFACGFPDAGIRLAGAHCLGLGTEKEPRRALQLLLQIEDKYPDKKMRIETAKKACNLL